MCACIQILINYSLLSLCTEMYTTSINNFTFTNITKRQVDKYIHFLGLFEDLYDVLDIVAAVVP